jgi:hypothetical protein
MRLEMYWAFSEIVWWRRYQDWRIYAFSACQRYFHCHISASNFWYRWNQMLRILLLELWWLEKTIDVLSVFRTCFVQEISGLANLRIFGMSTVSPLTHSCFELLIPMESDAADTFIRTMMIRKNYRCIKRIQNHFWISNFWIYKHILYTICKCICI